MSPASRLLLLMALPAVPAAAQSGGFVATLGTDTMHVERFARKGNRLEGVIVTRSPVTRLTRWSLTFDAAGRPARYEKESFQGDGTPLKSNGSAGSMTFLADSIVRETLKDSVLSTQRLATPHSAVPGPSLPYVGTSFLMYEVAFAEARRRAATSADTAIYLLTMIPQQVAPQRSRIWLPAADSAELDYFGQARSGYRFDGAGRLIRADWTGTTYRYRITRTASPPDVEAIAAAWAARDRSGAAMGPMSPRDTARASLGTATLLVDYSRPARRGRTIWGDVVPWGRVWRLGADMATHFQTSANLTLGTTDLPAGTYTLWVLATAEGEAQLIVNSQINIFGTNYNPARDFARVPLARSAAREPVERLTISIEEGRLWIRWGDTAWSTPIAVR